jgi:hypothetical protein
MLRSSQFNHRRATWPVMSLDWWKPKSWLHTIFVLILSPFVILLLTLPALVDLLVEISSEYSQDASTVAGNRVAVRYLQHNTIATSCKFSRVHFWSDRSLILAESLSFLAP